VSSKPATITSSSSIGDPDNDTHTLPDLSQDADLSGSGDGLEVNERIGDKLFAQTKAEATTNEAEEHDSTAVGEGANVDKCLLEYDNDNPIISSSLDSAGTFAEKENLDNTTEKGMHSTETDMEKEGSNKVPTKYVMGRRQNDELLIDHLFYMKPVGKDGKGLSGPEGHRLEDKGDEPLELTNVYYLALDWKNHEKYSSSCMVQSKPLVCSLGLFLSCAWHIFAFCFVKFN